ncbi:MAG: hypothetical protein E7332_03155 [Clostridiales bacterium]|nr:hypothetical protein [Clostridiales bacterium]
MKENYIHNNTNSQRIKVKETYLIDGIFYFVPEQGNFDMIYRAAMGVYWHEKHKSLYYDEPIPFERAFYWINEALKNEYGVILYLKN